MNEVNRCRIVCIFFALAGCLHSVWAAGELQTLLEPSFDINPFVGDLLPPNGSWQPARPLTGPAWTSLRHQSNRGFSSDSDSESPVIMMAGYMDSDISWQNGGILNMVAWVVDPDEDIESVEIYFEGEPTGVMLLDDGLSGDFGAGDGIFGLMAEIPEKAVEPAEFLLELLARDHLGNQSDLWPYLTIHE
ncbi:hypothetical protein JW823_03985 [bacterium]|nr:hypothetical protein [candidate division CSSED10-310 bacterium]